MSSVMLNQDDFGILNDPKLGKYIVKRFTWKNSKNVTVQVITYGATITSIKFPDAKGNISDVVMGYNNLDGYLNPLNRYFGATIGRVANRIVNSKFNINGVAYKITANKGVNHLHGGLKGFDKVNWDCYVDGTKVIMTYLSVNGEEGYPGHLLVTVTFQLLEDNTFIINFEAHTSKPTIVNLTNHSYFNLGGHDSGAEELYKHKICINADKITEVNEEAIPSGKLLDVGGTVFDLRIPTTLKNIIDKVPKSNGFDHNFCIHKCSKDEKEKFVARIEHPSGRTMEVYSNQPGVQFYTANFLPEKTDTNVLQGKDCKYYKHGAFCLETQNYPNAINFENFPSPILKPGQVYQHIVGYKFITENV